MTGGAASAPRTLATLAALALALGTAACSSPAPAPGPRTSDAPTSPGASGGLGVQLYRDPQGPGELAVRQAREVGDPALPQLQRIAEQPTATWVADHDPGRAYATAHGVAEGAAAAGRTAVLVAYTLPDRDCGLFSAGGASDDGSYLAGIGALAAGVADAGAQAVVVLEPDAVAHTISGCHEQTAVDERLQLLAKAVGVLTERPGIRVYLDAGNPTWVQDVPALAQALRRAGVDRASGFALNTSNFVATQQNLDYGRRLSDELGGAHFVVDTSRNGAAVPEGTPGGVEWCNPPQARIGQAPTTTTGDLRLDALLWVKQPGDSDGACRPGEPPAGQWWHDLAVQLAS